MFYVKKAENFNSFSQYKIFIDDKPIIEFLEKIPGFLQNNPMGFQTFFFNFIFDILNKDINEKYNETFVKKFIIMAENIFKDPDLQKFISNEIIEQFLDKIKNIVFLKNDNDYQNFCFNILKSNAPIWLFAIEQLLKLTPFLISNYKMNQQIAELFKTILTSKNNKKSKENMLNITSL